jgi:tRNA 5-methylaminomethyl-2-thiouridine biosynthesis bifunctional protein
MLEWKDGQPWSTRFGDRYFSADSGLQETQHVFLQGNGLAQRFAALREGEQLCIGETGFGTGFNFLSAWRLFEELAPPGAALVFRSVERFPLPPADLCEALAMWPVLQHWAQPLLAQWPALALGANCWSFARVRLALDIDDVAQALASWAAGGVDAWFLDGFAPARNPQMWSDAVMAEVARASRPGATLATYTSAGWVRRGLQRVGFQVQRVGGFAGKRQMSYGRLVAPAPTVR